MFRFFFVGYPISRNFRENLCTGFFWDIPYPVILEKIYVPFFFWDIPYPVILEKTYVPFLFWDIPYSVILEKTYVPDFFRDIPCTKFLDEIYVPFLFPGYRIYQNAIKIVCTMFFLGG